MRCGLLLLDKIYYFCISNSIATFMKRRIIGILLTTMFTLTAMAQHENGGTVIDDIYDKPLTETPDYIAPMAELSLDTLHLPQLDDRGRVVTGNFYPYYFGGTWSNWRLHEGLNLSLGASVFSQIGKHAFGGVGFSQNLSAQYATALTDRLSIAVGGYLNNMYWANSTFRDAGLTAVIGYRFDEHWEGYAYGQKTVINNMRIPYYLQDLGDMGDRIGAAIRYNFSPNFSIQMSVEGRKMK